MNFKPLWWIDDPTGDDLRSSSRQRDDGSLAIKWDSYHLVSASVSKLGPIMKIDAGIWIVYIVIATGRSD
jgi:hypothetical protein